MRASHFVMYSVLSITTRATTLSAITIMSSLSFLRFSSAKCSDFYDVCMYRFIGEDVKNSIDIMLEANAVNTIEFTCLESCHCSSGDVFLDGDVAVITANFGPFCSKDFSSSVSSFLTFQHKRQLTLHTFLISIYNMSVIPMFTPFKHQDNWIFTSPPSKKHLGKQFSHTTKCHLLQKVFELQVLWSSHQFIKQGWRRN